MWTNTNRYYIIVYECEVVFKKEKKKYLITNDQTPYLNYYYYLILEINGQYLKTW